MVKKNNCSQRLCVDYQAPNKLTIKDKLLIPLVDELLEKLVDAIVFFKVDMRSGYYQVRMVRQDVFKTTFKTYNGHYKFLVMHFGQINAPAAF